MVDNLLIAHIELRAENDPELQPYTHERQIDIVVCEHGKYNGQQVVRKRLNALMDIPLQLLRERGITSCGSAHDVSILVVNDMDR